jgi:hypothetical protein
MDRVDTPQTRGRFGFARADITPLVGIYHRMWGAALHERSTGVHRPLTATAVWLAPPEGDDAAVVIGVDQCILDAADIEAIRRRVSALAPVRPDHVHVTLSHTHGAGWMSRSRECFPGGELIDAYLKRLVQVCGDLAKAAADRARPGAIVYGTSRCNLAGHRDYFDGKQFVCGFHPNGPADDTVVVGKATADNGTVLGTLVNYACHPTTLAWQNTLISPDYVGAMRELVERETGVPCLFVQGASGELGPRDGYVGETAVADRNGRQLGYAAMAGLEAIPPPGTRFEYAGAVVSGATLGTWKHVPLDGDAAKPVAAWVWKTITVQLPYRPELPTVDGTNIELAKLQAEEDAARTAGDMERTRDCHAHVERMVRQLNRLKILPVGPTYPYPVTIARLGTARWVLVPGELYQVFQTTMRSRFPRSAVVVGTITNDWQPGYLPTAASYGKGIYQESIAVVAPGTLESLIEVVAKELGAL